MKSQPNGFPREMKSQPNGFARDITEIAIIVESCFTSMTWILLTVYKAFIYHRNSMITLAVEDEKQHKSYSPSISTKNLQQY